ncbi:UNVERIFIED_CONTAM: hypothetical protein GTU68_064479 [Idotea baltica]|nr:hypothetical protein [Idotea baltica]
MMTTPNIPPPRWASRLTPPWEWLWVAASALPATTTTSPSRTRKSGPRMAPSTRTTTPTQRSTTSPPFFGATLRCSFDGTPPWGRTVAASLRFRRICGKSFFNFVIVILK